MRRTEWHLNPMEQSGGDRCRQAGRGDPVRQFRGPEAGAAGTAGGVATARAVAGHAVVAAVTFTGSLAVGRELVVRCARRCVSLQAEMGGNNAGIVTANADLRQAVRAIADAVAEGGRLLCGADGPGRPAGGNWSEPTLSRPAGPASRIVQEELFGPFASLQRVPNCEAALRLANGARQGLAACL